MDEEGENECTKEETVAKQKSIKHAVVVKYDEEEAEALVFLLTGRVTEDSWFSAVRELSPERRSPSLVSPII